MDPLASLVTETPAAAPRSEAGLDNIATSAQARNRKPRSTGLLIFDQGRFLHWLEGPAESLRRVWQSIRLDRRLTRISVLGPSRIPLRLFANSAMALGKRRADVGGDGGQSGDRSGDRSSLHPSAFALPAELIEALQVSPQSAPALRAGLAPARADTALRTAGMPVSAGRMSLQALVGSAIVPELRARHSRSLHEPPVVDPRAAELARLLVAAEPRAAFELIDRLRADGRSIAQLCAGLFEPTARVLGDLWRVDDCSEFDLTLGLGHLQLALRRASLEAPRAPVPLPPASVPHAVLVAPSPREPHLLGSAVASEMFWRAGWHVSCEFPADDDALGRLVHARWFDVLELSLSGALTREHRLPQMAASIRAAHAHSLNPALTVIVDGRVFNEQPQAYVEVGADAGSTSALAVVAAAQRKSSRRIQRLTAHMGAQPASAP